MESSKVLQYIDNSVVDQIKSGLRWEAIIHQLRSKAVRYRKRESFIQVSEKYLVNNWDRIEWKKRLTTMIVIQSQRRIKDIQWIVENHKRFPQYGSLKMYKMIYLKDKLKYNINPQDPQ
jgi:hypothetical protein